MAVLVGLVVYNGWQTFVKYFAKRRAIVTGVNEPHSLLYPEFTICSKFKKVEDVYNVLDVLKIYQKEDNITEERVNSLIDRVAYSKVKLNFDKLNSI